MGEGELVVMTKKELERVQVIREVLVGHLTQQQGGERLGLSVRQVKRLCRVMRLEKAAGLASKRRGRPSNHQLAPELKREALRLVKDHYADFGPTLACEKLFERHDVRVGKETLRKLMIAEGLWQPKRRKSTSHPRRERRARRGELVQMDASVHDWFEDRGPKITLVAAIDDATGEVLAARFVPVEDTWAYFDLLGGLLLDHGRPLQLYTDRHSIFRATQDSQSKETAETQLSRALRELEIELICANSPQAKGRVERLFGTLQDRLVKELRLEAICTLEAGNLFLPGFLEAHNRAFSVVPASARGALRPLSKTLLQGLEYILCGQSERQLSKTLTIQYEGALFQVETMRPEYALRYKKVQILEKHNGEVEVRYKGQTLRHRVVTTPPKQARVVDAKQIALAAVQPPRKISNASPSLASRQGVARGFTRKHPPAGSGILADSMRG